MDVSGKAHTNTKNGKTVQGEGGQTLISIILMELMILKVPHQNGWYKMLGPDAQLSQKYLLNKRGGSLTPDVSNIKVVGKK